MNVANSHPTASVRRSVLLGAGVLLALATAQPAWAENDYSTAAELGLMQGFPPPPDKQVTKANALLTPPFNRWS